MLPKKGKKEKKVFMPTGVSKSATVFGRKWSNKRIYLDNTVLQR
jgi:hypothetical protein